jgi:AraC-like DNA-binding protein
MRFHCDDYLTDRQVREIIHESRLMNRISHYADDIENGFEIPYQVGQGYWNQITLRQGLRLGILDVIKCQNHIHYLQLDNATELTLFFYVNGRSQLSLHNPRNNRMHLANHSYALYLPGGTGIEEFPSGERIKIIQLSMNVDIFREFCGSQSCRLPADFQAITESSQQPFLFQFGHFTPAIHLALQQILSCPFNGFIRRLYLESKALELLALQFQQAANQIESDCSPPILSPSDLERIYAAKAILSDRLTNPPELLELAHLVGLNDFKLKQGFKQIFNTTVFGYVYEQRMQRAQQLLQERYMNVEEVAHALGYANRSSFATAFRRKFGINPKSYQMK